MTAVASSLGSEFVSHFVHRKHRERPYTALRVWYVVVVLQERATGLEPATSSLGSWHSTN